jgi:hypothetical protein
MRSHSTRGESRENLIFFASKCFLKWLFRYVPVLRPGKHDFMAAIHLSSL